MKHRSLVLAAVAAIALFAAPARAAVEWGLKAGVSTSQFSTDFGDTKWRTGAAVGMSVAVPITPDLAFAPELLYVRKGATLTSTNVTIGSLTFGTVKTGFDLDYLEVPLLLRYTLPSPGPASLFVTGGPTVSFKVNEAFSASGIVGYSFDSDQVKSSDFGAAVGAGVAVRSSGMRLSLEGRYEFGLVDVSELPFGGSVKNSGAQVMAGVEFPFGR